MAVSHKHDLSTQRCSLVEVHGFVCDIDQLLKCTTFPSCLFCFIVVDFSHMENHDNGEEFHSALSSSSSSSSFYCGKPNCLGKKTTGIGT